MFNGTRKVRVSQASRFTELGAGEVSQPQNLILYTSLSIDTPLPQQQETHADSRSRTQSVKLGYSLLFIASSTNIPQHCDRRNDLSLNSLILLCPSTLGPTQGWACGEVICSLSSYLSIDTVVPPDMHVEKGVSISEMLQKVKQT